MISRKYIKLGSQGKKLGEDHTTFSHLLQRMEIGYMTIHHGTKEHIGLTGKRIQLFASFPAKIHHAEAHKTTLKCLYIEHTMFVRKELGKWNVRFGVTSKVCEIRYEGIDQNTAEQQS